MTKTSEIDTSLDEIIGCISVDGKRTEVPMKELADAVFRTMGSHGGVMMVGDLRGPLWRYNAETKEKIVGKLVTDYNIAPIDSTDLNETPPAYWVLEHKGEGYSQRIKEMELMSTWLSGL